MSPTRSILSKAFAGLFLLTAAIGLLDAHVPALTLLNNIYVYWISLGAAIEWCITVPAKQKGETPVIGPVFSLFATKEEQDADPLLKSRCHVAWFQFRAMIDAAVLYWIVLALADHYKVPQGWSSRWPLVVIAVYSGTRATSITLKGWLRFATFFVATACFEWASYLALLAVFDLMSIGLGQPETTVNGEPPLKTDDDVPVIAQNPAPIRHRQSNSPRG